jgi:putative transposase
MSFVRIWVHLVFSTKNREPWIKKEIRANIYDHIISNCREKEIFLQAINGYSEHLHCLISLGRDQCISKVVQLIKGESSFWINTNKLIPGKFIWQDDYFAVSVSESKVDAVVNYIKDQDAHHSQRPFSEEAEEFMTKYGWKTISDGN